MAKNNVIDGHLNGNVITRFFLSCRKEGVEFPLKPACVGVNCLDIDMFVVFRYDPNQSGCLFH
jgi:hypothetical protein